MIYFAIIAVFMVIVALAFLLVPLTRATPGGGRSSPSGAALQVMRDRHRELDQDLRSGVIDTQMHAQAISDLQRNALAEAAEESIPPRAKAVNQRALIMALTIVVPMLAASLYFLVGNPAVLRASGSPLVEAVDAHPESMDLPSMIAKAHQMIAANDNDTGAWNRFAAQVHHQHRMRRELRHADIARQGIVLIRRLTFSLNATDDGTERGSPGRLRKSGENQMQMVDIKTGMTLYVQIIY